MKSRKTRLLWIAVPLIFLLLVLFSLNAFRQQANDLLESEACGALEQVAAAQIKALGFRLNALFDVLDGGARTIANDTPGSNRDERIQNIISALESSNVAFVSVAFAEPDGSVLHGGSDEYNIKDRDYFKQAFGGAPTLVAQHSAGESAGQLLMLSVPVTDGKQITGVLFGSIQAATIQDVLLTAQYEASGYIVITDGTGEVVLNSLPDAKAASFNDLFQSAVYHNSYSADMLRADVTARKSGVFHADIGSDSAYMAYTPIPYNNWCLFSAIPASVVNDQLADMTRMTYVLTAVILALALALLLFFTLESRRKNRLLLDERNRLYKSEELYRGMQDFASDTLFEVDIATGDITYNQSHLLHMGRAPVITSMFQYLEPQPVVYEEDTAEWLRFGKDMNEGVPESSAELRTIAEDGALVWHRLQYRYLYDSKGAAYRIIGKYTMINEDKNRLEQLQLLAETDSLTGLYNHRSMRTKVNTYLNMDGLDKLHALMVIDIDDFKVVNDTLGHIEGDAVLVHIAQSIRELFRATDVTARLGGDEFAVFFRNAPSQEVIIQKAEQLLSALQFAHMREGVTVSVSVSIGIAFASNAACAFELLYERADTALYQAKRSGKNRYIFFDDTPITEEFAYTDTRHGRDVDQLIPSGNASIQLRALLTNMPGGVLLLEVGPNIRPLYVSPSYYTMMGLPISGEQAEIPSPLIHIVQDDMPGILESIHNAASSSASVDHTYRVKTESGILWHFARAIRIPYDESDLPVLIVLITDVTQTHNTSKQLESIVKNAPLGIGLMELGKEHNRLLFVNRQLRSFIDYTDAEFDEKILPDANVMVDPRDVPGLMAEIKSAVRERRLAEYTVRTSPDVPTRCKWSLLRGVQLQSEGTKPLFLIMLTDLTALKKMELQAQANAERYRLAFDQTTATFWEYNFETAQAIQSAATIKEFGLTSGVYDNMPDAFINSGHVHHDSAGVFRAFFDQLIKGAPAGNCAVKMRRANGLYDWTRISYKTEFDPTGTPRTAIGIAEAINGMVSAKLRFEHEEWVFETIAVDMLASIKINLTRGMVDLLFLPGQQPLRCTDITPEEAFAMGASHISDERSRSHFLSSMTIDSLKEHYSAGEEIVSMEYRRKPENGVIVWAAATAKIAIEPVSGDFCCFGYIQDISTRKAREEAADFPIVLDEDTRLYDRDTSVSMVNALLTAKPGAQNAMLLIDIADFSGVERQYGIIRTKKLLLSIGSLLNLCVSPENVNGYLGNGRFMIFMPAIFSEAFALDTVNRSLGAIQSRGMFSSGNDEIVYSSGIILADEQEQSFQFLYDNALLTMGEVDAQNLSRYILYTKQM